MRHWWRELRSCHNTKFGYDSPDSKPIRLQVHRDTAFSKSPQFLLSQLSNGIHHRRRESLFQFSEGEKIQIEQVRRPNSVISALYLSSFLGRVIVAGKRLRGVKESQRLNLQEFLCRRRRIKCDEGHPCQACISANSACTFEEPGKRTHPHKSK